MKLTETRPALLIKNEERSARVRSCSTSPSSYALLEKRGKDENNEAFMPETASENGDEWEESEKITSRAEREQKKEKKNTDKESKKEGEGARGGGGESSEIRVTLRLSGTCSASKLKEKPKVCH